MALTQQTVLRQWSSASDDPNGPWFVVFDSTISEDVTLASTVTKHPIASGSPFSDHMYDEPDVLVIKAKVSDVLPWEEIKRVQQGLEPDDMYWSPDTRRSVAALDRLDRCRKAHEPFDVQTGLRLFQNMVCEKIHYVTDEASGGVLEFEAYLSSVKIVFTQVRAYPPRKDKKTKKAADKATDHGEVHSPTVEDESAKMKSILFDWFGHEPVEDLEDEGAG